MPFELGLPPSGHLHGFAVPEPDAAAPVRDARALREAFERETAGGLFALADEAGALADRRRVEPRTRILPPGLHRG